MRLFLISLFLFSCSLFAGAERDSVRNLHIFFVNDVHGGIAEQDAEFLNPDFPPRLAGGSAIAYMVQQYREKAKKNDDIVLVLDAGDMFQGTPIGSKTDGRAVIEYMNYVGFDVATAGNHDFDKGKENLASLGHLAKFPILSCNIVDKTTGDTWPGVKPYIIKTYGDLKIGIIGVTTKGTEYMSFPDHIKNLKFEDEVPSLKKYVKIVRGKGADIIIAMVHLGLPWDTRGRYEMVKEQYEEGELPQGNVGAMQLAMQVPGIDLMFAGHIHVGYRRPWSDPKNHTLVFQNYANGGNVGLVDIKIDRRTREIIGYEAPSEEGVLLLLQKDEFRQDIKLDSIIDARVAELEKGYDEVLGITYYPLTRSGNGESGMNNLVADAMKESGKADFAFTNFGGIRADVKAGEITPRNIFKVLPFGNSLVKARVNGRFLKEIVEARVSGSRPGMAVSGDCRIVVNKSLPEGHRVVVFELHGRPVQPDSIYTICTTDYLMEGNSGLKLLTQIDENDVDNTGILMRQAVIDYIKSHTPLKIKSDGRWERDDEHPDEIKWDD
jgi:2',3'-cyclic-nucleotide 2'-phosphodiesterase (5'-nucleotidase family)